jgi:hypothetical protein
MAYRIVPKMEKPAGFLEIAEARGIDKWRAYLDEHRKGYKSEANRFLETQLGDFISSTELNACARIDAREIAKLRKISRIRSEKLKGRWYYSLADVLAALKANP